MKKKILPIIVFILVLLGMTLLPYVPILLFHVPYNEFSQTAKILYTLGCDIVFMLILFAIYHKILIRDFKNFFKNFLDNLETSFKYYIIGFAIMVVSNILITLLFKDASANNEEAVRTLLKLYPVYMFFSVSIYAPITEELIFRKSIRDIFTPYGENKITKYLYIVTSGLIFAAMHVLGMVENTQDYVYIVPYLALGISFAALYHKTDNIFSSISMHFLHNTAAVILYIIFGVI